MTTNYTRFKADLKIIDVDKFEIKLTFESLSGHSGPIRVTLLGAALFQDKYLIISHFRQNLNFLEFQPTIKLGPLFTHQTNRLRCLLLCQDL